MDCIQRCDANLPVGGFLHKQCVSFCGGPVKAVGGAQVTAVNAQNAILNIVLLAVGAALIAYGVNRIR